MQKLFDGEPTLSNSLKMYLWCILKHIDYLLYEGSVMKFFFFFFGTLPCFLSPLVKHLILVYLNFSLSPLTGIARELKLQRLYAVSVVFVGNLVLLYL